MSHHDDFDDPDGHDADDYGEDGGPDTPEAERPPNSITIRQKKDETRAVARARGAMSAEFGATVALHGMNSKSKLYRDTDIDAMHDELRRTIRDESATGTDRLMAQAVVLDRLFTHMTAVAMNQEYLSGMTPALALAFRAQAQCRTTLQAVSDIRHPRQYVGTQNVGEQYNAGGHQQVNRDAHGSASENRRTELSEDTTHELHPDRGTSAGIAGTSPAHEAVGARHGATDARGQSHE